MTRMTTSDTWLRVLRDIESLMSAPFDPHNGSLEEQLTYNLIRKYEMSPKPPMEVFDEHGTHTPSLIRIHDDKLRLQDTLIEHFDHGFVLPGDHPYAQVLREAQIRSHTWNLIVLDTDEVHWRIEEISYVPDVVVTCVPWTEYLRNVMLTDEKHYDLGLRYLTPPQIGTP